MDHQNRVEQQFDPQANAYLHSSVHAHGHDLQELASLAARAGERAALLDLGCGAGHASFAVAPHVASVVAYDLSAGMLEVVKEAASDRGLHNISTRRGPAEQLPFDDGAFDLVISRYSAHHWSDPVAALRDAARVLKPHGQLCFIDVVGPHGPHAALLDTHLQAVELLRDPSHVRDYNPDQWRQMLQDTGFEPTGVKSWALPIELASWLARMRTPAALEAAVRILLAQTPDEVKTYYSIDADQNFKLESAMFMARLKEPQNIARA